VIAWLDVNVLIALAWPSHVHHEAAHRYRWMSRVIPLLVFPMALPPAPQR
jgi:hypothetical protein